MEDKATVDQYLAAINLYYNYLNYARNTRDPQTFILWCHDAIAALYRAKANPQD
jgi:hypothetical protein